MMSIPDFTLRNTETQWQRFCDLLWYNKDLEFWLDISRMHFSDSDFVKIEERFQIVFDAMEDLESGSIANKDEERQVGHYWLRNPNIAPNEELKNKIQNEIEDIEEFGNKVARGLITNSRGNPFTDVLWIGIGGSGLGPILIDRALRNRGAKLSLHFIDNVDPDGIYSVLNELNENLSTTLFITVSKSGGTPEPQIAMDQARERLEQNGYSWPEQAVAITMQESPLDIKASKQNWLKRFDMPDWVGGRTSITSVVGLLPASFIGCDIRKFLNGASSMDQLTRNRVFRDNPAALLASSWFFSGAGRGTRDMVVLPYRDKLEVFSRYLQQLVMESLGKKQNRQGINVFQGISVYGNKGSTDQHAYVQQLRDGIDNFFVTFIEVLSDNKDIKTIDDRNPGEYLSGFLQGTRKALSDSSKQSVSITIKQLDESTLGALIALFERAVGFYSELIDINAYNQPGVEAGKKAAAEILTLKNKIISSLSDGNFSSLKELQDDIENSSIESIFWISRHLTNNNNQYIVEGDWGIPTTLRIKKIV